MGHNLDIMDGRWAHLRNMLDTYFGSDPSNDDPLQERMGAVKADNTADYVAAVRADIADALRLDDSALQSAYDTELRSYYWPGGDGLTPRAWLAQVTALLALPPDTSRDHRSGLFEQ